MAEEKNEKKEKKSSGKVHFYPGKAKCLQEVAQRAASFLEGSGLETQVVENDGQVIVQAKRKSNIIKKVSGLEQAVTVELSVEGDDLKTVIGGAKWIDKAAGTAVGLFVVWPALLTTGWGIYKQKGLFGLIDKEITAFMDSKGL